MSILKSFFAIIVASCLVFFSFAIDVQAEDNIGENLGRLLDQLLSKDAVKQSPARSADTVGKRVPFGRGEMQLSFAPIVKSASPAVVNVYAARKQDRRSPFGGDPFFEQFFGEQFSGPPRVQSSLGSGVLVDASGIIVTNNHVIEGADEVKVALSDGREFASKILLKDDRVDLAILKIDVKQPLPVLALGNSDALEVGDLVLAMGNPFGVGQTTTSGIVSALARTDVGVSDFGFFIQTDAAINPGNSGGALLDMSGRLIGVNTAIFSKSGGSIGIGFAIPSNMVRAVVDAVKQGGDHVDRPYIGATFEAVSSDIADSLGMERPSGALVNAIIRGGPADVAGLRIGDIVLSMDGLAVEHPDALGYRLLTTGIGKTARFGVLSRGSMRLVPIKLNAAPESVKADETLIVGQNPLAGATVANLSPRLAEILRLPSDADGVVIKEVKSGSPAMRIGMEIGDILLEINGAVPKRSTDVNDIVSQQASLWRIKFNRNGQIIRQLFR